MSQISYTNEALKALVKHPQDRGAVFWEQVEKLGGRVIAFYHCMGKYDVVTIYEVPDEATASALILTVKAPGHLKEVETRSEEHTSELQSRQYLVCRLLLEKKKKQDKYDIY